MKSNNCQKRNNIHEKNVHKDKVGTNTDLLSISRSSNSIEIYKSNIGDIFKSSFENNFKNKNIIPVLDYIEEIYFNLIDEEKNITMKPIYGYMNNQKEINDRMRAILVDWLIQINFSCRFKEDTLYTTIWIIDTYLSTNNISVSKFQLLGLASFLISCKFNEIDYPSLKKFIEMTDNAYKIEELINMEQIILKSLKFNIIFPSANDFYNLISNLFNLNKEQYFLGKYFLDSCLINYELIKYSNSHIAISVVYIVLKYFNIDNSEKLFDKKICGAKAQKKNIKEIAKNMCDFLSKLSNSNLEAAKDKYSQEKYCSVATKIWS